MESTNDTLNKEYITSNIKSKRERESNKNDSNFVKSGDSYEERICDDLSEVILQYLSLEDKLRLECVSQQFRRTLFTKHYSLEIIYKMKKINLESIEKLIKKLTKLNEIEFFSTYENKSEFLNINQMFAETLIKNNINLTKIVLNYLTQMVLDLNTNKYKQFLNKDFIDKFGSTLVSLQIFNIEDPIIPYLSQLSNIEELIVNRITDLTDVHFTRLKSLEILTLYDDDIKILNDLIEDNRNTLKHLKISVFEINDEISFCKTLLSLIPKLKNLIDLRFDKILVYNEKVDTILKQIALNCNQLKRFSLWYEISKNNSFEDMLLSLKRFKSLKRLDLNLSHKRKSVINEKTIETDLSAFFKCEALRELTHLEIWFGEYYGIPIESSIDANNAFKDIEKYLPKLHSLIIYGNKFNCNENTAHILSQLSDLKTIKLWVTKESKHEIETKLKEKCKRITRIDINVNERSNLLESSDSVNSSDSDSNTSDY